jgi:23S rRNA pseudouridine1911/1915/1917 synthase
VNDSPRLPAPKATTRTVRVDPESEGQRLDVFLTANLPAFSRSALKRLIEENHVWVDGCSARASHKVRAGERITVNEPPPVPAEPLPEDIPISVIYEDSDILVVDKPPGLVVHPAPGTPDGTLVNALLHKCQDLSGVGGVIRPGIVHRLDRDTSGLLVVTKHDRAHRGLARQFHEHQVQKTYLAFAGCRPGAVPLNEAGGFDTFFGRHPVHRKRFSSLVDKGKRAVTRYRVLQRFGGTGWSAVKVQLNLETGRTHQIRVHLADADHPVLGDKLYGGRSARVFPPGILPERQALHAWRIGFCHPLRNEQVEFESPLPADLVELENRLREGVDPGA